MKIVVTEVERKEMEVDVEFPIFRKQDITVDGFRLSSIIYSRIDQSEKGKFESKEIHIKENYDKSKAVEIEVRPFHFNHSTRDYMLGQGQYKSSREEFEKAIKFAEKLLEEIRKEK